MMDAIDKFIEFSVDTSGDYLTRSVGVNNGNDDWSDGSTTNLVPNESDLRREAYDVSNFKACYYENGNELCIYIKNNGYEIAVKEIDGSTIDTVVVTNEYGITEFEINTFGSEYEYSIEAQNPSSVEPISVTNGLSRYDGMWSFDLYATDVDGAPFLTDTGSYSCTS